MAGHAGTADGRWARSYDHSRASIVCARPAAQSDARSHPYGSLSEVPGDVLAPPGPKRYSEVTLMSVADPGRSVRMNANVGGESFDEAFKRVRDMDASLDEQLRAFADAARQRRPDFAAAVDRLVERLRATWCRRSAPLSGEPMPPFVLPDEPGTWSASTSCLSEDRSRSLSTAAIGVPTAASTSMRWRRHTGDRGGRRSDRRHHARPAEIRGRLQVAIERAVSDPDRHGQRLRDVAQPRDLGRARKCRG